MSIGSVLVAIGFLRGLSPLSDNSFLTHLATGRLILDTGSVPSTDPYTFTAPGEPWVVQSWLASTLYAVVEAIGGAWGLRILTGLLTAAVVGIGWRLTRRAPTLGARVALAGVFLLASSASWSERPLMIGLLALGATALIDEDDGPAWLLLPIGAVWANVHGSYPLGFAYLVVVAAGRRADGGSAAATLARAGWLVGGVLLAALGPLRLQVLSFPVELLARQEVLQHVVEWQAPGFTQLGQQMFLAELLLAVVLLVRRPSYRSALVIAVFGASALLGSRNIPVASVVLLPGIAAAVPPVGSLTSRDRGPMAILGLIAAVVLVGVGAVVRLREAHYDLSAYPVAALAISESSADGSSQRLAAPDIVGNLRAAVSGPTGLVFADDRFDMFPRAVLEDQLALLRGEASSRAVLDRYDIEVVLWGAGEPMSLWMTADPAWRVTFISDDWVMACRRAPTTAAAVSC